jgi:hypothetical protein
LCEVLSEKEYPFLSITKPKIERVDKEEYMLLGEKVFIPMREKRTAEFHKWSSFRRICG